MRNIWLIARREFITRVRSGPFLFSTLIMTLILTSSTILPAFLQNRSKAEQLNVWLLDHTGQVMAPLRAALAQPVDAENSREVNLVEQQGTEGQLTRRMRKEADALLIVEGTFPTSVSARYLFSNVSLRSNGQKVLHALETIVMTARIQQMGISPGTAQALLHPLDTQVIQINTDGKQRTGTALVSGITFAFGITFALTMMLQLVANFVFQGVLEEKVSRVIEVVASSVAPTQMLIGKVLGLSSLGLIQGFFLLGGEITANMIVHDASEVSTFSIKPGALVVILLFLVMGFLAHAALMAASASLISRMEDQQAVSAPMMLLNFLPMLAIFTLLDNPNGNLAVVASLIPVLSQTAMIFRVLTTDVPMWQIVISLMAMAITTLLALWAGGRIYRAAMLSFGARSSLRQIIGYLRG